MSNVDAVKEMYAAFGRGDIPAILEHIDDNVEWDTEITTPDVPWLAPRKGKANTLPSSRASRPSTSRPSIRRQSSATTTQ